MYWRNDRPKFMPYYRPPNYSLLDSLNGRTQVSDISADSWESEVKPSPRSTFGLPLHKAFVVYSDSSPPNDQDTPEVNSAMYSPTSEGLRKQGAPARDMETCKKRLRKGARGKKGTGKRKSRKVRDSGTAEQVLKSAAKQGGLVKARPIDMLLQVLAENIKCMNDAGVGHLRMTDADLPRFCMPLSWAPQASPDPASAASHVAPVAGGHFFDVWRGSLPSGKSVAIKCLRNFSVDTDTDKEKMLARKMLMLSELRHENVLEMYGLASFQNRVAMVSPWMENGTVLDYTRQQPKVDLWELCHQVAEGMVYLHTHGMVHGDIKAHNVLISDGGVAKLTDFGLSTLSKHFDVCTTFDGGSVRWMAPELITREGGGPPESMPGDVYALGMTFLEILTGRQPFVEYDLDPLVTLAVLEGKHPKRPDEVSKDTKFGDGRWSMMLACWDMQPHSRPTTRGVEHMVRLLK